MSERFAAPDRIVIATSNPGKVLEMRRFLTESRELTLGLPLGRDGAWGAPGPQVVGLEDFGPVVFPEEGDEYEPNAIAKARAVATQLGEAALADDSGLEVDALGGGPGPRSARFGGPALDDRGRCALLLRELDGFPPDKRGARFVCVAALALPSGELHVARGECPGRILEAPRGDDGFGYDPVFLPAQHTRTMAELSPSEKDRLSHRGLALRGLFG